MCLEPTTGIEPVNLFLTKEVLYLLSYVGPLQRLSEGNFTHPFASLMHYRLPARVAAYTLERETGFEPATFSLEG